MLELVTAAAVFFVFFCFFGLTYAHGLAVTDVHLDCIELLLLLLLLSDVVVVVVVVGSHWWLYC